MRLAAACLSGMIFSGCMAGNNKDLGGIPPFNRYAGRTVRVLRRTYVYYDAAEGTISMPLYSVDDTPSQRDTYFECYLVCTLPPRYPIHIDTVRLKVGFDTGGAAFALGHLTVPGTHKQIPFWYDWGDIGHAKRDMIYRAPWEPATEPYLNFRTTIPGTGP